MIELAEAPPGQRDGLLDSTRGVRYLRVGTSSSTVRQADRGSSTISLSSLDERRRRVMKAICSSSSRASPR